MLMPQRKRLGFAVGAVEVNRAAKAQFPRFFFHAPNAPGLLGGPGFGFLRSLCSKNSFSVVTASVSLAEFFLFDYSSAEPVPLFLFIGGHGSLLGK